MFFDNPASGKFLIRSWLHLSIVSNDLAPALFLCIKKKTTISHTCCLCVKAVRSLKSTGKGACILPHGVLFRGNAEADIRKNLIRKGYIKGIIGLPANLFYGTGIPACIIVIDKENEESAHTRRGIFMIEAGGGYMKDGPKSRLRDMDRMGSRVSISNAKRQWQLPGGESRGVNRRIVAITEARNRYYSHMKSTILATLLGSPNKGLRWTESK